MKEVELHGALSALGISVLCFDGEGGQFMPDVSTLPSPSFEPLPALSDHYFKPIENTPFFTESRYPEMKFLPVNKLGETIKVWVLRRVEITEHVLNQLTFQMNFLILAR